MEEQYLQHKERLRKRYRENGLDGFHDYEVLELLLSYSLVRSDTKSIAKKLLDRFGSISCVMNASVEELATIEGISERTGVMLKIIKDSAAFMMRDKLLGSNYIKTSDDIREFLRIFYKGVKLEKVLIIYLNSKNMVIDSELLAEGTINEARVYMRLLVERCIQKGASGIVAVHNHPSGCQEISGEDIKITRKMKEILKIIDVRLLDHLIICGDDCVSLHDNKLI